MKSYRRLTTLVASTILAVAAGMPAIADDTEIFLATPTGTPPRPNVLIIIDTSGSMDTDVNVRPDFNPSGTYSGTCDENRVYWRTPSRRGGSTTPPDCNTTRWVSASNQLCKTATDSLGTNGTISIRHVAQWNSSDTRWTTPAENRDAYIECEADADINHGQADNDRLIAANGTFGPYNSDAARSIDWDADAVDDTYILYSGKYLNWFHSTSANATKTRLEIVQEAAIDLINGTSLNGTNVALMRFNSEVHTGPHNTIRNDADPDQNDRYRGGRVIKEFAAIESSRTDLVTAINNLTASGNTPLSETYYEAFRYYSGASPLFGSTTGTAGVAAAVSGGNYISPITASCQQNFIIYLTDGAPTDDLEAEPYIESSSILNAQCDEDDTGDDGELGDGICLDDLAGYMANRDFFGTAATGQPVENVRTFMIGFGDTLPQESQDFLQATADAGNGEAFSATDPVSLREAFENIASNIEPDDVSFTAPTVSVNAFNRTRNLNDLFFTVFEPAKEYHWPGNLKKYRISPTGRIMGWGSTDSAVDPAEGFFDTAAQSYWSDVVDGRTVTLGGAAHELDPPADRNLYTDAAAFLATGSTNLLSDTANRMLFTTPLNPNIGNLMLGLPAAAVENDRIAMIKWARGYDVDDVDLDSNFGEARFVMGDPLHSRPVSVIYGGSASAPEAVVFAATNDGYLHAFNPSESAATTTNSGSAKELWAYIPSELMPRLYDLRHNMNSSVKRYGLDGNLVAYKKDVDNDGIVESADGDEVLLFFGMGRGGSNYYALNVTNKTAPRLLWRKGAADTGMSAMGQTWSTPVVTKIMWKPDATTAAQEKLVVIVGGGYDTAQDGGTVAATQANYRADSLGNALYMLDAYTGAIIWSQGKTTATGAFDKMTNAFPGDVRVIDLTGDGYADRMYAADMGGRVWRFDINNGQQSSGLVTGGVFASLGRGDGAGNIASDARRFYSSPDVSILRVNGAPVLSVAIGSGFRGHPLNTAVSDRFYGLRDSNAFRALTQTEYNSLVAIVDNEAAATPDLVNVTTDFNPTIPVTAKGWKINFSNGEKVLSDSTTFNGSILFSTFTPTRTSAGSCSARAGTNKFYAVSATDGMPVRRDADADIDADDRARELEQGGIAPSAVILFPTPDDNCTGAACSPPPVCLVGPESCGISFTNAPVKTFWMQQKVD